MWVAHTELDCVVVAVVQLGSFWLLLCVGGLNLGSVTGFFLISGRRFASPPVRAHLVAFTGQRRRPPQNTDCIRPFEF